MIALTLSIGLLGCGSSDGGASHASSARVTSGADSRQSETHAPTIVASTDPCTSDADCIPGACCHPTTCVARTSPPTCAQSVCTSDCRYGTLDCGGACLCEGGHCAARLSQLPAIAGVPEVN